MMVKHFFVILAIFILANPQLVLAGEIKPDLSELLEKTPAGEKVDAIILFHQQPTSININVIKSEGAGIRHQYTIINGIAVNIPKQAAERIAGLPFVKLVEPDYEIKLVLDKSIPQIGANKIWETGTAGKNVDVAVMDTGIRDEHPALSVLKEIDYTGEGADDLHGHGTHVAGIIASNDPTYRGVAYGANLFNVKVLNKEGTGRGSDVIKGLEWAADNGAEIVSMSLGALIENCDGSDAISQAVDNTVDKDVVVVVAAGNAGPESGTITTPGCSKKGIAVGAVDDNDNVPSFSSRGPTGDGRTKPDLAAPGVSIMSTWIDNSFVSLSGTSMSTPHVSGVAALLLEADPTLAPEEVKDALMLTAVDLGLEKNTQGAGRVDAYKAFTEIADTTEEPEEMPSDENETSGNKTGESPRRRLELPPAFQRGLPSAGILPDSAFYGLKRAFERLDLLLTFDEMAKAEKHIQYAEVRLAEVQTLAEIGKPEFVSDLVEEYESNLERGVSIARVARQIGGNATKVTELVAIATSIHNDVLENVLQKVPAQAKPAIENAINSSRKGNEEALNAIEEVYPEKAAELHLRIAEKRLSRAVEKTEEGATQEVKELVEDYEEKITRTKEIAEVSEGLGGTSDIKEVITEATAKHKEILTDIQEKVPENIKPVVEKAAETSTAVPQRIVEKVRSESIEIPETPVQKGVSQSTPATGKTENKAESENPSSNPAPVNVPVNPNKGARR